MTIRITLDHWPDGDRSQTKRLGALTIEPLSKTEHSVELRDHAGRRDELLVEHAEITHDGLWSFIRDVLTMIEESGKDGGA